MSKTDLRPYIDESNIVIENILAERGKIFERNGTVVAQDEESYDIICYMDHNRLGANKSIAYVDDIKHTAAVLAKCLKGDEDKIYTILNNAQDLYQTELGNEGRHISVKEKEAIEEYHLPGIGFRPTFRRDYPLGASFSPYLLGFAQTDERKLVGKMGLEQHLDTVLSGINGRKKYQSDLNGYILPGMKEEVEPALNGYDVYLTLDRGIQAELQNSLDQVLKEYQAQAAWGAAVNIKNGKILAWGQAPNFDPNVLNIQDYNNYGSQKIYEPGSVFKPFAYAAAIDSGKYDGKSLVDSGYLYYYGDEQNNPHRTDEPNKAIGAVRNIFYKNWGKIPYDYGLIYSSNVITGSIVTDLITPETYLAYLNRFKLLDKVDSDGMAENEATLNFTYPVEKITATYGQGVAVSMLRLLQAYTAIFGNGEMIKPYFIEKIVNPNAAGQTIYEGHREVVAKPIKESTASELRDILERVVSDPNGTKRYCVKGLRIMAKTGTAEIPDAQGKYGENGNNIYSVMIGFPYEDPEFMLYFAFTAGSDFYYRGSFTPVTKIIKKIALLERLSPELSEETAVKTAIKAYPMPDLTNHQVAFALAALEDFNTKNIIIGSGKNVIAQFPEAGNKVYTGQKVFLLTTKESIALPSFRSWTRQEVSAFSELTKIPCQISGEGLVNAQSIPAGSVVRKEPLKITLAYPLPIQE